MSAFFNLAEWIPRWAKGEGHRSGKADRSHSGRWPFNQTSEPFNSARNEYDQRHAPNAHGSEGARVPESLENSFGSPHGSRASSIAGDRSGLLPSLMRPLYFDTSVRSSSKAGFSDSAGEQHRENDSDDDIWDTGALERPIWEPPVLDYRKFEEGGRMYDSLHRHPDTNPEQWYAYTDPEIERELLDDYHDFTIHAQAEAWGAGDQAREDFYSGLRRELDIDRGETGWDFGEVKERMYWKQRKRKAVPKRGGHRVQEQLDPVRKRWFDVDSMDSKWDEQEWTIFGDAGEACNERLPNLTEENLRRYRVRDNLGFETSLPVAARGKEELASNQVLKTLLQSVGAEATLQRTSTEIPAQKSWLYDGPRPAKAVPASVYTRNVVGEISQDNKAPVMLLKIIVTSSTWYEMRLRKAIYYLRLPGHAR